MNITVFHRTFWKENKEWPNNLEPFTGKKKTIKRNVKTEEEAVKLCHDWNMNHKEGIYSDRAEYMNE